MASAASSRGWGKGWPTNRSGEMELVRAPSGAKWQVHRDVAAILQTIVNQAEARGYKFDYGKGDVDDDWGYNNRPIANSRTASNHSWGLAVDIDAQDYPQGQRRKNPPTWLIQLFAQYKWGWGGAYSYADPMHFEFEGTRNEAQRMSAMIRANGNNVPSPAPTPPPAPQPEPRKLPVRQQIDIGYKGRLAEIAQWELAVATGAKFPTQAGIYWSELRDAVVNLGKVLGKGWNGQIIGPDQWEAIDFLYLRAGHEPIVT